MEKKEYPMDDDYNRALAFLVERIEERDELRRQLKLLPPAARPEALRLLANLDKAIEEREQKLAKEYEATQNLRRLEEERDAAFDKLINGLAGSYVHVKYRHPEMLEKLEATIADLPPEEIEIFYERAAQLESGDLIRIIAREGETREQTEEFLENYRRQEKEDQRAGTMEEIREKMAMVFIHYKYRIPQNLDEVKAIVLNDLTPAEQQEFYDRVARLEADDLISLIACEGETTEQTEEFLKNYRAAENKPQ